MKILFLAVFVMGSILGNESLAEQVTVSSNDHTVLAKKTVVYIAKCPDAEYKLSIDYTNNRFETEINLGSDTKKYDITDSTFASTFLHAPLYGTFGLTCAAHQLRLFYQGFEVPSTQTPRPVLYHFDLNSDGSIGHDSGLQTEKIELFNQYRK
jgi:hypothetical protein